MIFTLHVTPPRSTCRSAGARKCSHKIKLLHNHRYFDDEVKNDRKVDRRRRPVFRTVQRVISRSRWIGQPTLSTSRPSCVPPSNPWTSTPGPDEPCPARPVFARTVRRGTVAVRRPLLMPIAGRLTIVV